MILEIADILVKPGMENAFEAAAAKAVPLFRNARGCRRMELRRVLEQPGRYQLLVGWDTVEDHMVHFRHSPDFQAWRDLVGHCFAQPPAVIHAARVVDGF